MLWELLLLKPDPQARDPDEGLRILTPMGEPLQYSYFWVCGSLTWRVWDLIVSWKDLSYRLTVTSFLSLSVEYLFWKVWIFIVDVVQHLVVIWGLSWEEVNSSISNMPSCLCSPKFDFNSRNMFFFSFIPFPKLLLLFFSCSVMSNFLHPSNMQGFSVLHYLLELVQTHLHWASDAIQQSHPLFPPSPLASNLFYHQGLFQWVSSSHQVAKDWIFSFSISPSIEHPGLMSFKMDWLHLLTVQGTLKSLLQHHSSKASILQRSAFL